MSDDSVSVREASVSALPRRNWWAILYGPAIVAIFSALLSVVGAWLSGASSIETRADVKKLEAIGESLREQLREVTRFREQWEGEFERLEKRHGDKMRVLEQDLRIKQSMLDLEVRLAQQVSAESEAAKGKARGLLRERVESWFVALEKQTILLLAGGSEHWSDYVSFLRVTMQPELQVFSRQLDEGVLEVAPETEGYLRALAEATASVIDQEERVPSGEEVNLMKDGISSLDRAKARLENGANVFRPHAVSARLFCLRESLQR